VVEDNRVVEGEGDCLIAAAACIFFVAEEAAEAVGRKAAADELGTKATRIQHEESRTPKCRLDIFFVAVSCISISVECIIFERTCVGRKQGRRRRLNMVEPLQKSQRGKRRAEAEERIGRTEGRTKGRFFGSAE